MLSSHLPSWINITSAQNLVTHFCKLGDFAVVGFESLLTVIATEGAPLQTLTGGGNERFRKSGNAQESSSNIVRVF